MPFTQLVNASLEILLNRLLTLDDASSERLRALSGQRLRVRIREFPQPLTFAFSDKVDLLGDTDSPVDCDIELSINTLDKIGDLNRLNQLIQQKALTLKGDLHTAQAFGILFKELNIDWEEQLSRYTGDVVAHQSFNLMKGLKQKFSRDMAQLRSVLSDVALQEKPVAAHPLAVEDFAGEVNKLRADTARFEAKLTQLEQRKAGKA
ncbi:SCP2 sterol-binding domain-containing protein [Aliiglaciecola sp. CAU 1673]|uniref:ubiquinone biosynthesis accessory factor UbiJ n=1 Tax=Aliiglaciecola sp. CAU 1673 TaxID=3032595 RepID=UPI0023DBD666|nr:SCP2 sterol-binding domain-containing protein [Aliiglaciecola sp. CAU 1673]MDF2178729.1 SCP2 sterol-binding domain-containing protein [Aliiglaciecola sp. CAU 1673]